MRCPRCDETIPLVAADQRQEPEVAPGPGSSLPDLDRFLGVSRSETESDRPSNRAIAQIVLGVMATMALLAFAFAWSTKESRRERDHPKTVVESGLTRVISIAPAKLPGLAYLPENVQILAGAHAAELFDDPACQNLLVEFRQGRLSAQGAALRQWTGLPLEEIDHVVLGARLEALLLPHMTLVVRARRPVDLDKLRANLNAGRPLEGKKRTFYRYPLGASGLEGVLFQADERTFIYGLSREDLEAVPLTPSAAAERFSPDLRSALGAFTEGTQAWALGRAGDWQKSMSWLPSPELHQALSQLRGFTIWLQCEKEAIWNLRVECKDAAAADALDHFLGDYFSPSPDETLWRSQIAKTLKHSVDGANVRAAALLDFAR
jgi:hypothetical protein